MKIQLFTLLVIGMAAQAFALEREINVNRINSSGIGEAIGTITLKDSDKGLLLTPRLTGLGKETGHGFHIHENPSCEAGIKDGKATAGLAAGGHYDPQTTLKHLGPEGHGHLGDLPALKTDSEGNALESVVVPRLSLDKILGRSIIIHEGGDTHSDTPAPLGGGGPRIACGIIPAK